MKGSVTASCGHVLAEGETGVDVISGGEDCDAVDGFRPCLFYNHFCPKCAAEWRAKGWLFENEAEAWMDAQP
jgi:formylmethanofuran dehydrogenase subunit E-like metal-binding protein